MDTIAALQSRFGIANLIEIREGQGGLPSIVVTAPAADAEIYLHGAHVAHYQARGQQPLLFMSAASQFQPGKAIRGGVPVIFPWFGPSKTDPKAPAHGFARVLPWTLRETKRNDDGSATISLSLAADQVTQRQWPHSFELLYRVSVGPALEMTLEVRNTDAAPLTFEEALHTYLTVGDVRQVTIEGLAGRTYADKTLDMARKTQGSQPLRITRETDSHYLGTRDTVIVTDPVLNRRITVAKEGSEVTVVWNPWVEKAKAMSDFGDDEWPRMLCIETANAHDFPVTLTPGARHVMRARIHATGNP